MNRDDDYTCNYTCVVASGLWWRDNWEEWGVMVVYWCVFISAWELSC